MNTPPQKSNRTAMASTQADLRELKQNSQATVREIQSFLHELKGKNPQEMLGMVTSSSLFQPLLLSLALVTAAILLFTAIPYFMAGNKTLPNTEKSPSPKTEPSTHAGIPADAPTTPPSTTAPSAADIDSLGIGEELAAPPNINPLENQTDDFLKELE